MYQEDKGRVSTEARTLLSSKLKSYILGSRVD